MIKKFIVFFLLISSCFCAFAQYTEVINSNEPGFSESPYSVGKNVYQFESSFFHRNAKALETFSNPRATGLNLQFRTGFVDEKLEFNLTTAIQNNTFAFKNIFESSYNKTTLSQLTVAAKYLVFAPNYKEKAKEIRSWKKRHSFGWDRWIPHVAVYGGINFGSFLHDFHKRGGITPKLGVLLQNELSNQLNIVTNIYYNYIAGYLPEWSYILTATYNFNQQWSGFAEHQALLNKQEKQSNIGLGVAYLFSNDLQFNSTFKTTFQAENNIGIYAGIGASYRIDRHEDEFVELDDNGNRIDPLTKETYNKGFFGRMADKIKNIFKRKDKTEIEIDEEIATPKPTDENGKKAGRGRTRKKPILGDITKSDEKEKKETLKEKKKLSKKELKEKEKEEKKALKEKEKQAKAKAKEEAEFAKEQAKVERDIKKLEEEIAKEEAKAKQEELDRKYKEELDKKKKEAEKKKQEEEKKKEEEEKNNNE